MKTFDEIVDEVFYKRVSEHIKVQINSLLERKYISKTLHSQELLTKMYKRSEIYAKQPDVSEPFIAVCTLILEKPNRFHLQDSTDSRKTVVVDKSNNQKFITKTNVYGLFEPWTERKVIYPSFLTEDENRLLVETIQEWHGFMSDKIKEDREKREQKRKDKFRQEMIDLYKEDM